MTAGNSDTRSFTAGLRGVRETPNNKFSVYANALQVKNTSTEKAQITDLIKEAMGFSKERGDSLNVLNSPFVTPEKLPYVEPPAWKNPEYIAMAKDGGRYLLLAAVLLAVELLLFEWKPRSFIPVVVAVVTAVVLRVPLLGEGAVFPILPHAAPTGAVVAWAGVLGLAAGFVSGLVTMLVYGLEDAFQRLPVHWMWWPAIGAVFVGIGGVIVLTGVYLTIYFGSGTGSGARIIGKWRCRRGTRVLFSGSAFCSF